jgi:hypothetical protein
MTISLPMHAFSYCVHSRVILFTIRSYSRCSTTNTHFIQCYIEI